MELTFNWTRISRLIGSLDRLNPLTRNDCGKLLTTPIYTSFYYESEQKKGYRSEWDALSGPSAHARLWSGSTDENDTLAFVASALLKLTARQSKAVGGTFESRRRDNESVEAANKCTSRKHVARWGRDDIMGGQSTRNIYAFGFNIAISAVWFTRIL